MDKNNKMTSQPGQAAPSSGIQVGAANMRNKELVSAMTFHEMIRFLDYSEARLADFKSSAEKMEIKQRAQACCADLDVQRIFMNLMTNMMSEYSDPTERWKAILMTGATRVVFNFLDALLDQTSLPAITNKDEIFLMLGTRFEKDESNRHSESKREQRESFLFDLELFKTCFAHLPNSKEHPQIHVLILSLLKGLWEIAEENGWYNASRLDLLLTNISTSQRLPNYVQLEFYECISRFLRFGDVPRNEAPVLASTSDVSRVAVSVLEGLRMFLLRSKLQNNGTYKTADIYAAVRLMSDAMLAVNNDCNPDIAQGVNSVVSKIIEYISGFLHSGLVVAMGNIKEGSNLKDAIGACYKFFSSLATEGRDFGSICVVFRTDFSHVIRQGLEIAIRYVNEPLFARIVVRGVADACKTAPGSTKCLTRDWPKFHRQILTLQKCEPPYLLELFAHCLRDDEAGDYRHHFPNFVEYAITQLQVMIKILNHRADGLTKLSNDDRALALATLYEEQLDCAFEFHWASTLYFPISCEAEDIEFEDPYGFHKKIFDLLYHASYVGWKEWRSLTCMAQLACGDAAIRSLLTNCIPGQIIIEGLARVNAGHCANRPDLLALHTRHALNALSNLGRMNIYKRDCAACPVWNFLRNTGADLADVSKGYYPIAAMEDITCRMLCAIINLSANSPIGKVESRDHKVELQISELLERLRESRFVMELAFWAIYSICVGRDEVQAYFSDYKNAVIMLESFRRWKDDERVAARACRAIYVICKGKRTKEKRRHFVKLKAAEVVMACAAAQSIKDELVTRFLNGQN